MKTIKRLLRIELLVLVGVSVLYFLWKPDTFFVETKESDTCTQTLYYSEAGQHIYTYCLEHIWFQKEKQMIEWKEYPNRKELLTHLLRHLTLVDALDDGGTSIYQDTKQYTNNGLTVIACHTLEGNQDVTIGPKDMKFQSGFCKSNEVKMDTFTRTYHVYHIAQSNDDNYLYLTLRQFQDEEIETVKVPRSFIEHVVVGKNYEFTFQYQYPVEDNLKSIFENTTLIHVEETDKVGLEQIQESIK